MIHKNKITFILAFYIIALHTSYTFVTPDISVPVTEHPAYLGQFLEPWRIGDPNELIEIEFDNAEISSFINYIEDRYKITFIIDDAFVPAPKDGKNILGTKITFKTHTPLSKKESWSVFLKFLDIAGLTVIPGPNQTVYRIAPTDPKSSLGADRNPLPTFIGIHPSLIPDNDTHIRYVYFVKDAGLEMIKTVFDTMRSAQSPNLIIFPEVRGIIVTDKGYNIKAMLEVVSRLDTVTMFEQLSIIKLKRTDATQVAKFYQELVKGSGVSNPSLAFRLSGQKSAQTLSYFDSSTQVIPEPRTNSLIVLGNEESIRKIEDFILREIDKEDFLPYSPIHVYPLQHVQAEAAAEILSKAVQFQTDSIAAKTGGVRDGDKYFKPISIVPEKSGNRLIITSEYEDFIKINDILKKIDVEQPQVAFKVLILNVDLTDTKEFGTQIRNKKPGTDGVLGSNINFQTSGLGGITNVIENTTAGAGTGAQRLLGNLVSLALGGKQGTTFMTLGSDTLGVWGMFRVLQSFVNTTILSHPFFITTNNYPTEISLGEKRRVLAAVSQGAGGRPSESFENLDAKLTVSVTPQISYEGLITIDIIVQDNQFTETADTTNGNRTEKEIRTSVILANNEVLALGGIVKDSSSETESKNPILGNIPFIGWLFKNKNKQKIKQSLLILISAEIIPVANKDIVNQFSAIKAQDAIETLSVTDAHYKEIDPIHKWFFKDMLDEGKKAIKEFIEKEEDYIHPIQKDQREKSVIKRKRLSDFVL